MNNPHGLCVDKAGNVYIADTGNQRIRKIVPVTNKPTFALGNGQFINPISAASYSLNVALKITDRDLAQTETWTVVSAPTHGTLSGFPATASSEGTSATTKPASVFYTSASSFYGPDSFQVKVSDGLLADTVTIYVWVGNIPVSPHTVIASGPTSFAVGTNATTAVNMITESATVNIFPNPVSSILSIQWAESANSDNTGISISDIAGHVLYHAALSGKEGILQVDVSDLAPGMYHTSANGQKGTFIKQ
jgi:hypothetical protein